MCVYMSARASAYVLVSACVFVLHARVLCICMCMQVCSCACVMAV